MESLSFLDRKRSFEPAASANDIRYGRVPTFRSIVPVEQQNRTLQKKCADVSSANSGSTRRAQRRYNNKRVSPANATKGVSRARWQPLLHRLPKTRKRILPGTPESPRTRVQSVTSSQLLSSSPHTCGTKSEITQHEPRQLCDGGGTAVHGAPNAFETRRKCYVTRNKPNEQTRHHRHAHYRLPLIVPLSPRVWNRPAFKRSAAAPPASSLE